MHGALDDLRQAFRLLRRDPRMSALIVLILALGIGANTTAFSFLEATVLAPFPYDEPERLVEVVRGVRERFSGPFTYRTFAALRDGNDIFEDVVGYRGAPLTIVIGGETESVMGTEVSAGTFELLGYEPALGRDFTADEQGTGRAPVAIISHHLWQTRFDADPDALGDTIWVDGRDRTIVGVMPPGFAFYQAAVLWLPLPVDAGTPEDDPYRFSILARLRDDVTLPQAHAAMASLRETLEPLFPEPTSEYERSRATQRLRIATLAEGWNMAGLGYLAAVFQAATVLVLLIVCANLASLFLARGTTRQRELAVRQALGAPRARLVRQLFTENLLFAMMGGAAGLLLGYWGQALIGVLLPNSNVLLGVDFGVSWRVFAFVAGATGVAVIAFGLMPALELSRTDIGAVAQEWGAGATGARRVRRRESALAILQVALSLVLLVGATLAGRTLTALGEVDPGFDAHNVFAVLIQSPEGYDEDDFEQARRRVAESLQATPGIEAVASRAVVDSDVRGSSRDWLNGFVETPEGPSALSGRVGAHAVNDDYFRTFGLDILRGRGFDEQDRPGSAPVAMLNRRAAEILVDRRDPLGLEIRFPGSQLWFTVVGVVDDRVRIASGSYDRAEFGMRAEAWPEIYFSARQLDATPNNLMWVRPPAGVANLQGLVRSAVAAVDPRLPLSDIRSVWESEYEPHQGIYRVVGKALGVLGSIAVLLAALGTYSVIAYTWSRRAREIGVRMAFGATASEVFRLVLAHTQKLALTGILLGALSSLALYRIADSLFFNVRSWDPVTYVTLAILLSAIAAVAGMSPARRATRTDPAEVLRGE